MMRRGRKASCADLMEAWRRTKMWMDAQAAYDAAVANRKQVQKDFNSLIGQDL